MRILPELEAYRERLLTKAAGWPDESPERLGLELQQCLEQLALLTRAVEELKGRLAGNVPAPGMQGPPEAGGRTGSVPDPAESDASTSPDRILHRLEVQEQTRDLTAAFAEALRRHLEGRTG